MQNTPEPPKTLPNASEKRNEVWNTIPESSKKPPEKAEKP